MQSYVDTRFVAPLAAKYVRLPEHIRKAVSDIRVDTSIKWWLGLHGLVQMQKFVDY